MKERPILFSGPMVRAILDGSKTQTRRVIQPQPCRTLPETKEIGPSFDMHYPSGWRWHRSRGVQCFGQDAEALAGVAALLSPYGKPGDRLWVRETWAPVDFLAGGYELEEPHCVGYRADESARYCFGDKQRAADTYAWNWSAVKWKPSIFMPRWASRITLEVIDVRVQRVRDIGESDAVAEGMPAHRPLAVFRDLWETLNAKRGYGWDVNPWVWAVTFRRVQA